MICFIIKCGTGGSQHMCASTVLRSLALSPSGALSLSLCNLESMVCIMCSHNVDRFVSQEIREKCTRSCFGEKIKILKQTNWEKWEARREWDKSICRVAWMCARHAALVWYSSWKPFACMQSTSIGGGGGGCHAFSTQFFDWRKMVCDAQTTTKCTADATNTVFEVLKPMPCERIRLLIIISPDSFSFVSSLYALQIIHFFVVSLALLLRAGSLTTTHTIACNLLCEFLSFFSFLFFALARVLVRTLIYMMADDMIVCMSGCARFLRVCECVSLSSRDSHSHYGHFDRFSVQFDFRRSADFFQNLKWWISFAFFSASWCERYWIFCNHLQPHRTSSSYSGGLASMCLCVRHTICCAPNNNQNAKIMRTEMNSCIHPKVHTMQLLVTYLHSHNCACFSTESIRFASVLLSCVFIGFVRSHRKTTNGQEVTAGSNQMPHARHSIR